MQTDLTLIIAAYNEEKHIAKCIDSILEQTYKKFNIIIIDDGSTDRTANIIKEYTYKAPNIYYIYQNNSGAAAARRKALDLVKTKYVSFVDADDLLSKNTLELALTTIRKSKSDVVLFNLYTSLDPSNMNYKKFKYSIQENSFNGKIAFSESILEWGIHALGIYKTKIFIKSYNDYYQLNPKKINYINNDEIISRLLFLNSEKITKCEGIYYYQFNNSSITKSVNPNYYLIIKNTILLKKYSEIHGIEKNLEKKLCQDVYLVFKKYRKWVNLLNNRELWISLLKKSINNLLYSRDFWKLDFKNKKRVLKMKLYFIFHRNK